MDIVSAEEHLVADPTTLLEDRDVEDRTDPDRTIWERQRLATNGIGAYSTDNTGTTAAFQVHGHLFIADLEDGKVRHLPTQAPVSDPRLDPTGKRIGYISANALHVTEINGQEFTVAGGRSDVPVKWGCADYLSAEEFGRFRGYWWSPGGDAVLLTRVDESVVPRWYLHDPLDPGRPPTIVNYPRTGESIPLTSLHLFAISGQSVEISWDSERYPYLVKVNWDSVGPMLTVLDRSQRRGLVLNVNLQTGTTEVIDELLDPFWIPVVDGLPCRTPDGRVVVARDETGHGQDRRSLFIGGKQITTADLYVRRVSGFLQAGTGATPDLIVEGSDRDPSQQHIYRVRPADSNYVTRLTNTPGWHTSAVGGDLLAIARMSLEADGTEWTVQRAGQRIATVPSVSVELPYKSRPIFQRVTEHKIPTAVLYPRDHTHGNRLPVLVDIYGGPGRQLVVSARSRWQEPQWWADSGFAVVTIDNRGTPGVSPGFEKAIHGNMAEVVLADQVEALSEVMASHPDLDRNRVAIRGWSYGGWLAGLAVLRRPDIFRCGVVGAPVTDWALYNSAYTERYLGTADPEDELFRQSSLIELAKEPPITPDHSRPLLLIHGTADDNVILAHTLRLSAALLTAGRRQSLLMLPGASHMLIGELAEKVLELELDFVWSNLNSHGIQ